MSGNEHTIYQLKLLEEKIKNLLSEKIIIQNSLKDKEIELVRLKTLMGEQNEELKNFQNQHKITKIVDVIADDTNNMVELRLLLNKYIREIDKCIAQLSE
jgi:hypothetical protein